MPMDGNCILYALAWLVDQLETSISPYCNGLLWQSQSDPITLA